MKQQPETQPETIDGASLDVAAAKRGDLLKLFPEVRTEGDKIDFDALKRALGEIVDPGKERYGMTWPGKADCFKTIQSPSMATLLPVPEKSVDFDTTENVIIEGDNLEVLKLLQKSYLGKIKMIYIDPPYNTGNDFIYPDNYSESLQTYLAYTGQVDTEGRKFGTNTETDGRFHSKWLNMMYPRLYLARALLREDGALFVSINDVELGPLLALCKELFGEGNHLATFIWINEGNVDNQSKIKTRHEYIVAFARDESKFDAPAVIDPNIDKSSKLYRDFIENSIVKNGPANPVNDVTLPAGFPADFEDGVIPPRPESWPQFVDPITVSGGKTTHPRVVRSGWSSRDLLETFIRSGCVPIIDAKGQETTFFLTDSGTIISRKRRSQNQGHVITELRGMGTVRAAATELSELGISFSYPKPVRLLKYLVQIGANSGGIVLDFFAGSGTMGQAVIELNDEEPHAPRSFILVQLPELTGSPDFPTLADVAESRVKRFAEASRKRDPRLALGTLNDVGFRVFRLATSNVKAWVSDAPRDAAAVLRQMAFNIGHVLNDRTDLDILYEVLLKSGYVLSTRVEQENIARKAVYSVADGSFLICLDRALNLDVIRGVAERRPGRVLLLDEGFSGNDQLKTNAAQLFRAKEIVLKTL